MTRRVPLWFRDYIGGESVYITQIAPATLLKRSRGDRRHCAETAHQGTVTERIFVMQYFGIPTCPYCKKHINLVRTWRLKREGEYKCRAAAVFPHLSFSARVCVLPCWPSAPACASISSINSFWMTSSCSLACKFSSRLRFSSFLSLFTVYLKRPVIRRVQRGPATGSCSAVRSRKDVLEP